MWKTLRAINNQIYHIDRKKVSLITEAENGKTAFIIDGQWVIIDMYIDNAEIWLNSTDDS